MTAAMGAPSLPIPTIDNFIPLLFLPYYWHSPTCAERARSYFEDRSRLLPLELRHAHQPQHPPHSLFVETLRNDFFGRLALFHVKFQNLVQQLVWRQTVLVGLIGAQFG